MHHASYSRDESIFDLQADSQKLCRKTSWHANRRASFRQTSSTLPVERQINKTMGVIRIEDLSGEQLDAVLAIHFNDPAELRLPEVNEFIDRIGGVRNARMAIDLLRDLEAGG